MIELPEAQTLARQVSETLTGKTIVSAKAASSPHGFAWYFGDPASYGDTLNGKTITGAQAHGGRPEIVAEDMRICVGDGVNMRYLAPGVKPPSKHQLLLDFDDGSAVCCTVQMYGCLEAFPDGQNDNYYYLVQKEKPSPLDDEFDYAYFQALLTDEKLSAKAFLATQQRIPGLGNGVLQDVLWASAIHPKRKMNSLSQAEIETMFASVKSVLADMTAAGGRDTEKDLFGEAGRYPVVLSRRTDQAPCPRCGNPIKRAAYLGGNVYFCEGCQPLSG